MQFTVIGENTYHIIFDKCQKCGNTCNQPRFGTLAEQKTNKCAQKKRNNKYQKIIQNNLFHTMFFPIQNPIFSLRNCPINSNLSSFSYHTAELPTMEATGETSETETQQYFG